MSVTILRKRQWTPGDRLKAAESPGRPTGRIPGSYIDDLAALRKCVVLCPLCVAKFSAKTARYRQEKDIPFATGRCDGCRAHDQRCRLFVAEEAYQQVRMTKDDARSMAKRGYTFVS